MTTPGVQDPTQGDTLYDGEYTLKQRGTELWRFPLGPSHVAPVESRFIWNLLASVETSEISRPEEEQYDDFEEPRSTIDAIGDRPVVADAIEVIERTNSWHIVKRLAALVDGHISGSTYRGGRIAYEESFEDPEDWEIVVISKLAISTEERFGMSLRIGEALNELIAEESDPESWLNFTFRLDMA